MLSLVGSILIALALATTLGTAFAAILSIRQSVSRRGASGLVMRATWGFYLWAAVILLALALLGLLGAFLTNQYSIRYVAEHSSRSLPAYLKISAVWAGQEGSLLLWSFLQALFTALAVGRPSERTRPLVPWATVFLSLTTAFFTGLTLFLSNPFASLASAPADGLGLSPLLRHPGMVFHPPALYLGYVGLAVPFAFGLSALISRQFDLWATASRRWTLVAWLFLGIGLLLGARWAYDVLGWGGYWGWDPVENAGLMPWLTATALLHGIVMQERRESFHLWNLVLAVGSFLLVLFGTFTTRSGMIQSVHAFQRSSLGPYFLAVMGLILVGFLWLLMSRRKALASASSPSDMPTARAGLFTLTLTLLVTITVSVLIGSVLPTLTEVLTGGRFEAGPAWFDRVTGPQFGLLVVLMGICPLVGSSLRALRARRNLFILLGALLVALWGGLAGFTRPVVLVGMAIIGLAGSTALAEYIRDVAASSRQEHVSPFASLVRLFGRAPRRYGGYLVHLGIVLMALGVLGTRLYAYDRELVLRLGQPATEGPYTLVYEDIRSEERPDYISTFASVSAYQGGKYLTTLVPRLNQYLSSDQTTTMPALHVGWKEDLYLVLAGWSDDGATVTCKLTVNPLINFLWLGGLVFLAGGALAAWPQAQVMAEGAPQSRRRRLRSRLALAALLLLLVAAAIVMWGTNHGSISQGRGRPLPGQAAPALRLVLLDGKTLSPADLAGKVTVLNFWASWCVPCRTELPALQSLWQRYVDRDVLFLGVGYSEVERTMRASVSSFGLTYPQALDVGNKAAASFGITGVPETFVLDKQGHVAYLHIGGVTAETLTQEIETLLKR